MRNRDLPKLLRALAKSDYAIINGFQIIFDEAANNLDKLTDIEMLAVKYQQVQSSDIIAIVTK